MIKLVVMLDGGVAKEYPIVKERTTLGRRPHNDVVLENLAVSGEHAILLVDGDQVILEDRGSTNGTFVNGKAVKRQAVRHGDTLEIGKFKIRVDNPPASDDFEKTMVVRRPIAAAPADPAAPPADAARPAAGVPTASAGVNQVVAAHGAIRLTSGPAAGREVPLTKVVTTLGKPGVCVAAITHRQHHFLFHQVDGSEKPMLNGLPVGSDPVVLKTGDEIALAGTHMVFVQG